MKVGIDSYCYHRFFGEVYPDQEAPGKNMAIEDFLARAHEIGAEAVSLETCFLPSLEPEYLKSLKPILDEYGFDRVFAWGHPDGLERGKNEAAFEEVKALIPRAVLIGADVMRVTGSSLMFRHEDHQEQLGLLAKQFKACMAIANDSGVRLAVENHIDFTSDEILQLIEMVDDPNFGVNFDTGNFLRLLDDPVAGMEKLAPYVFATHCKDLDVDRNVDPREWFFFAGVPVGRGLVDNMKLAEYLAKAGYQGFLAVEIDHPHTDWVGYEDEAVSMSVKEMKRIRDAVS
ncbi:MAG: sugar phosphate isomerase/epimerase [Clostridiales Family XIII bacterium]|nr:sugar phosphate isomerase/epimerase [Clostridiales Family XIII bacterium]